MKDPKPRNKWTPRAEPGTIFGPCSSVSGGMWTYYRGAIKVKTNIAIQGMNEEDLNWVKTHMDDWDPPDGPIPLPEAVFYDACSLTPSRPVDGGTTKATMTCQACIAIKRKRAVITPHTTVWGECLKATPPHPIAITSAVQPDAQDTDDEIMFTINEDASSEVR